MPQKYQKGKKFSFSGRRVKRGLYQTKNGLKINSDINRVYKKHI